VEKLNTKIPSFEAKDNMLDLHQGDKKIHPAIEHFQKLQVLPPSIKLQKFLSKFNEPRPIDSKTFAEGVKIFITLANSHPLDDESGGRQAFYGSMYSGLHYRMTTMLACHPSKRHV
jgi:hypothetical protein